MVMEMHHKHNYIIIIDFYYNKGIMTWYWSYATMLIELHNVMIRELCY